MAVYLFMRMKGEKSGDIKGEARDAKHKEEMDVLSFKWGMMSPTDVGSGRTRGATQVKNFTFEKPIDKSTPILANALLTNEQITQAVFTCRKAGLKGGDPVEFTIITFEKAHIINITRDGESDDDRFTEEITLAFQRFTEDYTEQTEAGTKGAKTNVSYSLAENK